MSWKSLITAGLFCMLASPVFAGTPTVTIRPGGNVANNHLDSAEGQWAWDVYINPDESLNTNGAAPGTPVAAEIGFRFNAPVVSATRLNTALFDTLNPGKSIFGWESTSPGGVPCNANGNPCGIQIGPTAGVNDNEVFAAVGSANLLAADRVNLGPDLISGGPDVFGIPFMHFVTSEPLVGPGAANPTHTTSIQVLGAAAYGNNARVSQIASWNGTAYTTGNFDLYAGTFTQTANRGDANLDGAVNALGDYVTFSLNYPQSGKEWYQADFDGDDTVGIQDYVQFSLGYPTVYTVGNGGTMGGPVGGGASLGGGTIPEPASAALMGLAVLGGLGIIRRKR